MPWSITHRSKGHLMRISMISLIQFNYIQVLPIILDPNGACYLLKSFDVIRAAPGSLKKSLALDAIKNRLLC